MKELENDVFTQLIKQENYMSQQQKKKEFFVKLNISINIYIFLAFVLNVIYEN